MYTHDFNCKTCKFFVDDFFHASFLSAKSTHTYRGLKCHVKKYPQNIQYNYNTVEFSFFSLNFETGGGRGEGGIWALRTPKYFYEWKGIICIFLYFNKNFKY